MSLIDLDTAPRLADTMRARDLNLDACIKLAGSVLSEAALEYINARRELNRNPGDRDARHHIIEIRRFYKSDYFKALSNGLADGDAVMYELDKHARG